MKRMNLIIALAFVFLLTINIGCTSSPTLKEDGKENVKTVAEMTKELVASNDYIEIDPLEVNSKTVNSTRSDVLNDEEAKTRAVLYRFYSHVSIKDGKYTTTLRSASEINVSEKAFNFLMDNLAQINENLDSANKDGDEVILADIGEEYLNSLLQ